MGKLLQILGLLIFGFVYNISTALALERNTMQIKIGDRTYSIVLNDNSATKALQKMLPMTIEMSDLNGNEKYYYLQNILPSMPEHIGQIKSGDIMLFNNDCLVVFYKDFKTAYSYARIGYINNAIELEKVLGHGNVTITFK